MFASFVIGLREGLEAALIVGIIWAFLQRNGRSHEQVWVWTGVGLAVGLCALVAVGLKVASAELPERGQMMLEAGISIIAVTFVTWMIMWMRRHARTMKSSLEASTAEALATGSIGALVVMAFLAVLREGFETAVFLLAQFQETDRPLATGAGAVAGIAVAVVIGVGIARGGMRVDLARFFKVTGFLLVLIAAGLLAYAMHEVQELGWIAGEDVRALNLSWLAEPGTLRGAIVTGMFGIRAEPSVAEVAVWLAYAVPMGILVLRPAGAKRSQQAEKVPTTA
ncbi:MAG: iron uptake transporter permease EfeU [Actinomycetota bacterium]